MFISNANVTERKDLGHNIVLLKLFSPEIASRINPGEFLNIKVSENSFPLLRRPFSVCDVEDESIYIMFHIAGEGTRLIASKQIGGALDIIGPLGKGFNFDDDFETAVFIAGGIGAAPFPYLKKKLNGKRIRSFIGGRSKESIIEYGFENIQIATDDGSRGFHGNVVQLFKNEYPNIQNEKIKLFACGPTPMLKAIQEFALEQNINCEISTECAMACGFGICQGCPIESTKNENQYSLVCKDGPVFNAKDVVLK
ncbi:MAG: dihydroorotate dehydrogenase electron transfer subunit [Ignavibacteriaceae bacterium]|nr:dihydroorotate dehydrogenase electron transfer subunit [Ignavibacteriaceae bacterium]